jgi:hypothetical protein
MFRLLLFYGLFVVPRPLVAHHYAALFREGANGLIGPSREGLVIRFRSMETDVRGRDVQLFLQQVDTSRFWTTPISSRMQGYLPTAEVLALILATPIPWKRRLWALIGGVLIVHVFIAVRVLSAIAYSLNTAQLGTFSDLSPFWRDVVFKIDEILTTVPTTTFVVPVFVWILVTFRRGDHDRPPATPRLPQRRRSE